MLEIMFINWKIDNNHQHFSSLLLWAFFRKISYRKMLIYILEKELDLIRYNYMKIITIYLVNYY